MSAQGDNMARLTGLEGITQAHNDKLSFIGVRTTGQLLVVAAHRQGREDLASQTGISEGLLLKWVNLADLMRIKGIGEEYSGLLEAIGVDTVIELRRRKPDTLHLAMLQLNEKKRLVRRLPTRDEVGRWIEAAKSMKPKVTQ